MHSKAPEIRRIFGLDLPLYGEGATAVVLGDFEDETLMYATVDWLKVRFYQEVGFGEVVKTHGPLYLMEVPVCYTPPLGDKARRYASWYKGNRQVWNYYGQHHDYHQYDPEQPDEEYYQQVLKWWVGSSDPYMSVYAGLVLEVWEEWDYDNYYGLDARDDNYGLWNGLLFPFDVLHSDKMFKQWKEVEW